MLALLIAAWLLFALSVAVLHGWIVPRIGEYRGALEAQASKVIGVPVRIGSITADSRSLFPSFELRDVVLHDDTQREALRLARVVASVSPRSLWRLSFEQIYIERPELEVRRDAAGKLHVAGLDTSSDTTGESQGADWFFSQREFMIEGGTVRWTDEQRGTAPLLLTEVRFVARNSARRHQLRLDATPPAGWGERFTLRGQFRQPLLSVRSGNWKTWDGQFYAELPRIDVTRLDRYVRLDARIREGTGALRLWADIQDGQFAGGAADLALARVDALLGAELAPLALRSVTGRLAGRRADGVVEFSTTNLQFETADGLRWPGGNLFFQHALPRGRTPERGALRADRLDLGVLALIANRLPLGDATHKLLADYAPRGLVERIDASWQGALDAPYRYQVRGRASGLTLASQAAPRNGPPAPNSSAARVTEPPARAGRPGLQGATLDIDASQAGGNASLAIAQGALDFPGVFEEPLIPIEQLSAQLQWKLGGDKVQLQVANLRFANADAQGEAQASWRTGDPARAHGKTRFPGVLDLQGKLSRADGTRVFRYLPLVIPKTTRDYVRAAVTQGVASAVDFRVRGDLADMPFLDPREGEFRIAARVADVSYAYVPPAPGAATKAGSWPALAGLAGELLFERAGMQVRNARGRVAGAPGLEVVKTEALIADMSHKAPVLQLDTQARGPLDDLLRLGVPLLGEAGAFAAEARASGNADYRLKLELPLQAMDKAKVQATVALGGNELQLTPAVPPLQQARGTLSFTESSFSLAGVQGHLVGGDVRIEGRGRYGGGKPELALTAQGSATAEGLRAAREIDWLARLARKASGAAAYTAALSLQGGVPEFSLTSSLQGMALQLPAPLVKSAEQTMPLRVGRKVVLRETRRGDAASQLHDQLQVELGAMASAQYLRDVSGDEPRVLRGSIAIGLAPGEAVPAPPRGVLANVRFARLDVDAWRALFGEATGQQRPAPITAGPDAEGPSAYLPSQLVVRAQQLTLAGRTLHEVVMGATREGPLWRGNIDAQELSGYVEYRQVQAGRLHARLARLKIAAAEVTQVESLLDEPPDDLPALDIVVDDFELLGRRLGRAEIDAVNRGGAEHEWRLNKLNFSNPDASFTAHGTWAWVLGGSAPRARGERRRTAIDFKLDIDDAGALLTRLGMQDVLRRGRGRMEGEVEWRGSPFSLDYPSLGGQLNLDVVSGQFLKAEPGIAKLLGVLSLQALPRRLSLDFRDVFSQGFAFDFIRGDARISAGTASTNNLQMKGVNAAVLMSGSANIARETQDLNVVVVPELNAGTAALVATAINPAIGLGTFLAQMVLRRPLIAAATQEFQIDGTWADPKITKVPRRLVPPAPPAAPAPSVAEERDSGKELRQ